MSPLMRVFGVVALATTTALAGCTANDPLADTEGNFTSADGAVVEIAAPNRGDALSFSSSATTDGSTITTDGLRGRVVVVNFWYASCPPCRAEADTLARVAADYADRVSFVGVNVYDQRAVAISFEQKFHIPYPSVLDVDKAEVRLAFAAQFGPNAVPTTIVLDTEGRVAGRISGVISDESILSGMLDGVLGDAP